MTEKPFGRRVSAELSPLGRRSVPRMPAWPHAERADMPSSSFALAKIGSTDDDDLRDWKRARRQSYRLPWRQLLLMASLCFGVAAFVLPNTVSDALDWLLYGLMIASFVAGIGRRRDRRVT